MHRYSAASWSDDVDCTWEVLKDQIVVGQQVNISGQPWWGTDVGGCMYMEHYNPELFARWFQWGAFCPIFRTHGVRSNNEPWSYGEHVETIIQKYIELRYALMPYIYTCAYETAGSFAPMMRPMFYAFPEDAQAAKEQYQFLFGENILVAPVTEKGARTKQVWLPEGLWYDFHTGEKYLGGRYVEVYLPGGKAWKNSGSMVGSGAAEFIKSFTIDRCFCGVSAVSIGKGISHPNLEEVECNRAMVEASVRSYVVTDSSKFNQNALFKMFNMEDVDGFIVDDEFPNDYREYMEMHGIETI